MCTKFDSSQISWKSDRIAFFHSYSKIKLIQRDFQLYCTHYWYIVCFASAVHRPTIGYDSRCRRIGHNTQSGRKMCVILYLSHAYLAVTECIAWVISWIRSYLMLLKFYALPVSNNTCTICLFLWWHFLDIHNCTLWQKWCWEGIGIPLTGYLNTPVMRDCR